MICAAATDAGSACADQCICANCAAQAATCFQDPGCARLVVCANKAGCTQANQTEATTCASMACPSEIAEAGAGLGKAITFATCVGMAMCYNKCSDGGSTSDAPSTSDASDAATGDGG
jgi:hypothetical protein